MQLLEKHKSQGDSRLLIHIIGIGGIGMSGIAEIMHNLGYSVQGSDLSQNLNTQRLSKLGIKIFQGHNATNIIGTHYVVISSAVKQDNPEVVEALRLHIPVIKRAEMLAELMRFKTSIAISGSHGKTTTTSLVASMFEAAGLAPTVINGGIINNKSTNAYLGAGDYFIAEADESDATFIKIPSTVAVITNIDPEHMDYYHSFDNLVAAFEKFITNLPFYGFAVACIDHKVVRSLVSGVTERKVITYGIDSDDAHVIAYNIRTNVNGSIYDLKLNLPHSSGSVIIENIALPTPGRHNVLNSLAAIAIAAEFDFGIKTIKDGFKNFNGVKRRFTKVGEYNGARIIDDYAHHPVEVTATISTARSVLAGSGSNGRIIAIFQPHRYSRVQNLFEEFTNCFDEADKVYIADIYSAGESPIDGITGKDLVSAIKKRNSSASIYFLESKDDLPDILKREASPGDIVLMMGAGNITQWAAELPSLLNA